MVTFFGCVGGGDPPSEVRLARGILRGEVSIASCLGYSVCGCSEATL